MFRIMDPMMERELRVACEAARAGGEAILAVDPEATDRGDLADRGSEETILTMLRSAFPDDGILSEETPDDRARLEAERVWIVDPLDGTREYVLGLDEYAVSVALVVAGRPVVAAVGHPASGKIYQAVAGRGAMCDGRSIRCSSCPPAGEARIVVSRSSREKGRTAGFDGLFGALASSGSIALRLVRVAAGDFDGTISVHPLNEWDLCGGDLVLTEAGGTVRGPAGEAIVYNRPDPALGSGIVGLGSGADHLAEALRLG